MIDCAEILVDALNDDPDIFALLIGGVSAYRIPPEAAAPLALVMVPSANLAAAPSSEWWSFMATIDIHAEAPFASLTIADKVARMVPSIVGDHPSGVVADCQVMSIVSVVDGAWTPTRYRQIVTVDVTAREPLKEV